MVKGNYMVTLTSTYTKTETWLVENETKEDAKNIAESQNQSPNHKCTLWNEEESDGDYDDTIVKEVLDARYSEKYRKDNNINVSNKSDNKSKSKEFKKNNVADD